MNNMVNGMANNFPYAPNYMTMQQRLNQLEQQLYNNNNYNNYNSQSNNTPTQNVTWIQVNGITGAKEHIVQPNQTAWLMDNNDSVFFVKSADNLGVTSLKCYKFFEINPNENAKEEKQDNNYVSIETFNELQNRFNNLEKMLINSQQNAVNTNVSKQQTKSSNIKSRGDINA